MADCEIEIQESEVIISNSTTVKSDENESCSSTRVKKSFVGQEIIQNLAVVDIVFAVSHLCHFFFRLAKFAFHNIEGSIVYFCEFCWIALFGVYLLQFFMGSSVFLGAKDVVTQASLKHLISICSWWIKCSIVIIIVHIIDGLLLSVPMNAEFKEESGQKYLYVRISFISSLSLETVAHISEFLFRLCAMLWVRKFVMQFYKLEVIFPCHE